MIGRGLVLGLLFSILLTGFSFSQESFAAAGDPTVDAGLGATIDEGDAFFHVGSFTLPDDKTNWTATVDYGSGDGEESLSLNFGDKTFTLDHLYNEDDSFPLTVEITNGTHTGIDTTTVTVNNVAPTVDAGPGDTLDEGGTFSHAGSFTDPGDDTWTATVDYGDGAGAEPLALSGKTFALDHVYTQDSDLINSGPFEVTVSISDGADTSVQSIFVTVNNILPSITSISDATIDEGDAFTTTGSFADPGADAWTGGVNWAGMDFEDLTINPDKTFDLSHIFENDGVFTVSVTVSDGPASESTEEFDVTVLNVDPTLTLGSGATIDEGDAFTTTGSFTDPGNDSWTITADFGDGTSEEIAFESDKTFEINHVFQSSGTFTVLVTIDDGTTSVSESVSVTVNNVAPIVDAGPDGTVDEGDSFDSMGTVSDAGSAAPSLLIDYGDGTSESIAPNSDGTFDFSHVYSDDGSFTISVTADDGTDTAVDTATVTVNNILPQISLDTQSVDENRLFTGTGSFVDPGDDAWTATVDYDDGAGPQSLSLSGKTFSLSNSYSVNGVYDVSITVSDDDGTSTSIFMIGVFVSDATLPSDLNSPVFTSQMFTDSATFVTTNQDIWGPVTGGSGTSSWNLFNPQGWDERDGDSSFTTLAGKRLGAGISVGTNGHLEMTGSATDLAGTTGVNYPGSLKVTHPDTDSFLAGEGVPVQSVWTLDSSNAKINAGKTMGDLSMNFDIGLEAFIDTEVCILVGCEDLFVIPDIDFDTGNTELFSITKAGDLNIPSSLSGLLGFTGDFNPIMVQPTTTSANPTTGRVIAETTNKFSDIVIDIDKIATHLGLAPPLGRNLSVDGVGLSYDFFDADAIIDFKAHQKLTFDTGVLVKLDFSRPITGVTGSVLDLTTLDGEVTSVTYREGNQVNLIFPQGETDPITVTPTVFLDPSNTKLHQFTEVITESDVNMKSLETSIGLPSFTVVPAIPIYNPIPHLSGWECHGILCVNGHFHHGPHFHKIGETPAVVFPGIDFSVGPAWNSGPQGQEIKKDTVANKAFKLGGFNTVTLATFELNPEVPPTAEANGPYEVLEGSIVQLLGTGEDLDGDPITFAWDFDGDMVYETSGATVDYPLGIDGPDTLSAELQVCDDLNCDEDFATITVINVAPTVDTGDDETIDEGDTFTRTINFEDPGADTWDVEIDYGDGFTESLTALSDRTFDLSHTYADDGSYTVSVIITDDDAGVGSDSFVVSVNNVDPTTEAGDPDSVDEGSLYSYVATFTDPGFDCDTCGTLEDFTATIDWGDNTGVESLVVDKTSGSPGILTEGTASGSHHYADNGVYTVTVTVTDDDSGVGVDTFDITVNNVDPTVEAGADQEVVIHDLVELDPATFSDPGFDCTLCGTLEDFASIVNWGEGSDESLTVDETPGSPGMPTQGTASGDHIYRLPGDYTVTVSVDDDDAGTHNDNFVTTVLGAQDLKNRAISFLTPYDDEKRIQKAIDAINDSLDSELWVDEVYLDSQHGHMVYSEEHKAVQELQQLLKDGEKKGIDASMKATVQDSIDLLVNADRVLTITIMLDAASAIGDKPNDQSKIDKENQTAEQEFAQGDAARDSGDYDNAIQHYRQAWEHSGLALKFSN